MKKIVRLEISDCNQCPFRDDYEAGMMGDAQYCEKKKSKGKPKFIDLDECVKGFPIRCPLEDKR